MPPHDSDPERDFQERFAALVEASGLSIRDIAKRTSVGRSTIDGWKRGEALPQNRGDLITVVEALQAAAAAVGRRETWGTAGEWTALLRRAKDERDAHSYPARRHPHGPASDADFGAERHARTIAATGRAIDALSGLLDLDDKPDWDRERRIWAGKDPGELDADKQAAVDAWEDRRREFLRVIKVAILDIGDAELRARLEEAVQVLELWAGPMQQARQSEGRTRYLAATEASAALGAFRRGDPLPEQSADYRDTKEFADLYLEELQLNAGNVIVAILPASQRSRGDSPSARDGESRGR
jgi:transcriptional regulator with XRE-family HTH domain